MSNISDLIEQYLKKLLEESLEDYIEIQRSKVASYFNCVPSQINYVLTTRFSTGHGYIVESRRGGGGFIRIVKLPLDHRVNLVLGICNMIGESISRADAIGLINRLQEEELITQREKRLMCSVIESKLQYLEIPVHNQLRALLLKAMVTAVLKE
ncbi:MAG: CtsR family transcriptional regulator [Desulfotomaculaceae bacterium]|nr:CtsR family transcriptional regulator [Desulfotomaculaceae bacterium]